jgi:catechol 2,3-dioxygenase-like lactoylglutathione lyase family enzyme
VPVKPHQASTSGRRSGRAFPASRGTFAAMQLNQLTPILNVSSIEQSIVWFEPLGWHVHFRWPDGADEAGFAGLHCGKVELFLCRGAQGARGGPSPRFQGDDETGGNWMSWWVGSAAEVDEAHALALRLAYEVSHPPTDEPWGVREFHLRHPDGHTFRVSAPYE